LHLVVFVVSNAKQRNAVLFLAGTIPAAKKIAADLIGDVDFDSVDAGPFWIARYTASSALIVGQLAYKKIVDPERAYRFE
jgi:hypothetical protein